MKAQQVNVECRNFNFENRFVIDKNRMGGGLALFWNSGVNVNSDVNVTITSYSSHHIDAVVHNESGKVWRYTGVYGHLEANQKHHTWTLLKRLAGLSSYPWCCFGDFNEILHLHEKTRGNDRNINLIAEFREAVQACNLVDVGYERHLYTWSNRRYGPYHTEERLDRFLCSKK